VITHKSVSDVRALYVADPFIARADNTWHMFFEVVNLQTGLGEIGLASSQDMIHWDYRQIVLREPFHLSYPYVFEWNHDFYMIPETHQAKSVRLYKSVNFPIEWTFIGNLLVGDNFVDSSLFRFGNRWWLLNDVAVPPYFAGTLRLFSSDSLLGPWIEHPKSPIISENPHIARPGGRVVVWNDRVIRFTQDCSPVYGAKVRAFELLDLTVTSLQERELSPSPVIQGTGQAWNKAGMHHIDPHLQDDGRWLASVDGCYWTS
jgi:hypothetical protein